MIFNFDFYTFFEKMHIFQVRAKKMLKSYKIYKILLLKLAFSCNVSNL